MRQTGIAHLPLHGGKAPAWLFQRMVKLGREILRLIIEDYGPEEILTRLADPHWFQSLGCVLGFDWHSSGVTTTVCGALKEGLKGRERKFGLVIVGGLTPRAPDLQAVYQNEEIISHARIGSLNGATRVNDMKIDWKRLNGLS